MIYLDNAATSLRRPEGVVRAVSEALCSLGNVGRGASESALSAARVVYAAREKLCAFFGGADPSRVCFTQNSTEALNTAIFGLLRPGDHVISTDLEHNSVLRPLYRLEQEGEMELIAALLSGDETTFKLFRTQAPELVHLPDATYEWYCRHYLDRYYPVRFILHHQGIEFPRA